MTVHACTSALCGFPHCAHEHDMCCAGQMLNGMLGKSCQMLQSLGDFVNNPDVADDSFLLAGRALHYSPRLVLHEPLLSALLDAATAGVLVQHKCACSLCRNPAAIVYGTHQLLTCAHSLAGRQAHPLFPF